VNPINLNGAKEGKEVTKVAIPLDPNQIVSFEVLLMSKVVQHGALTGLLVEKGIFTNDEFLEMVRVVNKG
jgi:hypothetical protein